MAINHDLTYQKAYQIAFADHADYVCFLDLGNRFEVFGMDALFLEKEYGVAISRITPRGRTDGLIRYACRVPVKEGIELMKKLIADGHKVAVAECRLTPRAIDRFQREPAAVIPLQTPLFADELPATTSGN